MQRKTLWILLGILAALCAAASALRLFPAAAFSLLAFPFEQIGGALRALSLSGPVGNGLAIALYLLLCLLPLGYLALRKKRAGLRPEEGLLVLLSALLLWCMYLMINPGDIGPLFGFPQFTDLGKAVLSGCLYSVLLGYGALRLLRRFQADGSGRLLQSLRILLFVLCAVFVYAIFGQELTRLFSSFSELAAKNTDGASLLLSQCFLVLRFGVAVLPFAFDLAISLRGVNLTRALSQDPYGEAVVREAEGMARLCRRSVCSVMLAQIGVNVLQLLLAGHIRTSSYSLSLPLLSVLFLLLMLLLSQFFAERGRLKRDNDLFV